MSLEFPVSKSQLCCFWAEFSLHFQFDFLSKRDIHMHLKLDRIFFVHFRKGLTQRLKFSMPSPRSPQAPGEEETLENQQVTRNNGKSLLLEDL